MVSMSLLVVKSALQNLKLKTMKNDNKSIKIYSPIGVLFPINPREINSVGDQIILEHILPFHNYNNSSGKVSPLFSTFHINYESSAINISVNNLPTSHLGHKMNITDMYLSFLKSLSGTIHSSGQYKVISQKIDSDQSSIFLKLNGIPNNLNLLLTIPDFAIIPDSMKEITKNVSSKDETFGPYFIDKVSTENNNQKIILKRNVNFPEKFRANSVETVEYRQYQNDDDFFKKISPDEHALIYINGKNITNDQLISLKEKKFKISVFPNEWLILAHFNKNVSQQKRVLIRKKIDAIRDKIVQNFNFSTIAFSSIPQDRPGTILKKEYDHIASNHSDLNELSTVTFGALSSNSKNPFINSFFNELKENLPKAKTGFYSYLKEKELFLSQDVIIEAIGMSPRDPLSHYSYLQENIALFKDFVSTEKLNSISLIQDQKLYEKEIHSIEEIILKNNLLIPIAHFPGIVAEAPGLQRDPELSWSWGIQAWTYHVR